MADFETKKINELTEAAEVEDTDLTVTGDPGTGVLKKISILNFATSIKDKILGKSSDIADIGDGTVTGAIKQLDSDISDTQEITTDAFDETKSYAVGDYCIYDNTLYKFKEEKSAGEWDEESVEKTNTMTELNSSVSTLNSALAEKADSSTVSTLQTTVNDETARIYRVSMGTSGDYVAANFCFSISNIANWTALIYLQNRIGVINVQGSSVGSSLSSSYVSVTWLNGDAPTLLSSSIQAVTDSNGTNGVRIKITLTSANSGAQPTILPMRTANCYRYYASTS